LIEKAPGIKKQVQWLNENQIIEKSIDNEILVAVVISFQNWVSIYHFIERTDLTGSQTPPN